MAAEARPTILAVDDDPGILESFEMIFEPGHEVVRAPDGSATMEILRSRLVDLVLLDLRLPDVNGLVLLSQIREMHARLPVIVVSIIDRAHTALEAMRLGANDYVPKPFEEDDLLMRVRGLLSEQQLRPPHILVIEPDIGMRAALTAAFERECLVSAVASLERAAHELRGARPDVIIVGSGDVRHDPGRLIALGRESLQPPVVRIVADFHAVLAEIAAHLPTTPGSSSARRFGRRTAGLIQCIAGSYPTITVASLAEAFGVSTTHISRSFGAEVDMALQTFIMRVRIHAALYMVQETEEKMDEIASRVGLYDGAHLCHVFARYGFRSPGSYR